jgi:hypothetical protein
VSEDGGSDEPRRRSLSGYPFWALILLFLGWGIVAIVILLAGDLLIPVFSGGVYGPMILVLVTAAFAYVGIAVGLALVAIDRSGRRGPPSRWKVWAKLLMLVGGIFSVSIPLAIYAVARFGADVFVLMRKASSEPESAADVDHAFAVTTTIGGVPFLVGLFLFLLGLLYGRDRRAL